MKKGGKKKKNRKRDKPSFALNSRDGKRRRVSFASNLTSTHIYNDKNPMKKSVPKKNKLPRRSSLKKGKKDSLPKVVFQEEEEEEEDDDMRLTIAGPNDIQNPLGGGRKNEILNEPNDLEDLTLFKRSTVSRSSDMRSTVVVNSIDQFYDSDEDEDEENRSSDMRMTLINVERTPPPQKKTRPVPRKPRPSTIIFDDVNATEEEDTETYSLTPRMSRITQQLVGRSPALRRAVSLTSKPPPQFGIHFVKPTKETKSVLTYQEFMDSLGIPDLGGLELNRSSLAKDSENTENLSLEEKLLRVYLYEPEIRIIQSKCEELQKRNRELLEAKASNVRKYNQNNPTAFTTLHNILHNSRNDEEKRAKRNRYFRFLKKAKNLETLKARVENLNFQNETLDQLIDQKRVILEKLDGDENAIQERKRKVRERIKEVREQLNQMNVTKNNEIIQIDNEIRNIQMENKRRGISGSSNEELRKKFVFFQNCFLQSGWKNEGNRFEMDFSKVGRKFIFEVKNQQAKIVVQKSKCIVHDGNNKIRERLLDLCKFKELCSGVNSVIDLQRSCVIIHKKIQTITLVNQILFDELFKKRDIFFEVGDDDDDDNQRIVPLEIRIICKKGAFKIILPLDLEYPKSKFENFKMRGGKSPDRNQVLEVIRKVDCTYLRIPEICDQLKEL